MFQAFFPAVDFIAQLTRTFERNDLALAQDQIGAGGRIPAPSLLFLLHAKFSESGNKDVVSTSQRSLDDLEQGFDRFNGFLLGKSKVVHLRDDIVLGQCHSAS